MSLNKQITDFRIVVNSTTYDLPVQNMESSNTLESYTSAETSVGGRRFVRTAGIRQRIQISYDGNINGTDWRNLVNDILTHIVTNGNQFFDFYYDATETTASDLVEVQPENLDYLVNYNNTIGTFVPSLSLIQRDRQTSITSNFEAPS